MCIRMASVYFDYVQGKQTFRIFFTIINIAQRNKARIEQSMETNILKKVNKKMAKNTSPLKRKGLKEKKKVNNERNHSISVV